MLPYFSLGLSLVRFLLQLGSPSLDRRFSPLPLSLFSLLAPIEQLLAAAAPARQPRWQQARHGVSVFYLQHDGRVRKQPGLAQQARLISAVWEVFQNEPGRPGSQKK